MRCPLAMATHRRRDRGLHGLLPRIPTRSSRASMQMGSPAVEGSCRGCPLWGPACSPPACLCPFGGRSNIPQCPRFFTVSSGSLSARCCVVVRQVPPSALQVLADTQSVPEPVAQTSHASHAREPCQPSSPARKTSGPSNGLSVFSPPRTVAMYVRLSTSRFSLSSLSLSLPHSPPLSLSPALPYLSPALPLHDGCLFHSHAPPLLTRSRMEEADAKLMPCFCVD